MLVPVTSSLYVNGTVMNPDKVLVDIGTGYFVEVGSSIAWYPGDNKFGKKTGRQALKVFGERQASGPYAQPHN